MKSKMSLRWIMVGIAGIMVVLFSISMGNIEIMGTSQNLGGFNIAFGIPGTDFGNPLELIGLIVPVGVILLYIFMKEKAGIISAIACIVDFMVLILVLILTNLSKLPIGLGISVGFIIYEILALAVTVLSFLIGRGVLDMNKLDVNDIKNAVTNEVQNIGQNGASMQHGAEQQEHYRQLNPMNVQTPIGTARKCCPKCGALVLPDSDFCIECGTKFVLQEKKICPHCKRELEAEEVYCPFCGVEYYNPAVRICPSCGRELKEEECFCSECGQKYYNIHARICKKCASELKPEADYCGKCGTRWE